MRIEQQVHIARSADEVWRFLADVPQVVNCIPGAELGEDLGGGQYRGAFRIKVGPISARLEGEGRITRDDAARSGTIEGKGIDKRGGSRVSTTMTYAVRETPDGAVVDVAAELTLAGPLSQIGRTSLIEDVAKRLTAEFAAALAARLTEPQDERVAHGEVASSPSIPSSFDAGRAIRAGLLGRVRNWKGR